MLMKHVIGLVYIIGILLASLLIFGNTNILHYNRTTSNILDIPISNLDSSQEGNVTLAFFLQIHRGTMDHLPRLLKKLWEPVNVYAIHVDAKVHEDLFSNFQKAIYSENSLYKQNVHFITREVVTYRGVSMVLNTLNGMEFLLRTDHDWDFFINLSGSDYPLIHPRYQRMILASGSRDANYFHGCKRNKDYHRYAKYFADEALSFTSNQPTKLLRVEAKNPIFDKTVDSFSYFKSEAWMINSRSFASYATGSSGARKLLAASASAAASDEIYFPTLAYNSQFNETIVENALRLIIWGNIDSPDLVRHGMSPYNVDQISGDSWFFLEEIRNSTMFFVRKFREANSRLMDIVDEMATNETRVMSAQIYFSQLTKRAQNRNSRHNHDYVLV